MTQESFIWATCTFLDVSFLAGCTCMAYSYNRFFSFYKLFSMINIANFSALLFYFYINTFSDSFFIFYNHRFGCQISKASLYQTEISFICALFFSSLAFRAEHKPVLIDISFFSLYSSRVNGKWQRNALTINYLLQSLL